MWCKWLLRVSFLLLLGIFGFISSAVATEYTYVGPNDGTWTTQTYWSPLPTSPYTFPYGELNSAWINADPGTNVNVYLNHNIALNGLKVDAGDSLTFVSIAGFALTGIDPYVMNNGAITFKGFTVGAGLTATFSGTGTLNHDDRKFSLRRHLHQ